MGSELPIKLRFAVSTAANLDGCSAGSKTVLPTLNRDELRNSSTSRQTKAISANVPFVFFLSSPLEKGVGPIQGAQEFADVYLDSMFLHILKSIQRD